MNSVLKFSVFFVILCSPSTVLAQDDDFVFYSDLARDWYQGGDFFEWTSTTEDNDDAVVNVFYRTVAIAQENEGDGLILSVFHGLDPIPPRATALCGMPPVTGQDGMPVTFSVRIDGDTVSPAAFAVETSAGKTVTPLCATLRPAVEPLERRTVLLIGPFSPDDSVPVSVEIVGPLEDVEGRSLFGSRGEVVTALEAGPSLVLAERLAPGVSGLDGECPEETAQAVLLTWEGGVSGPRGADLAEAQRTAVSVLLQNGDAVHPLSLGDDDPDNHVVACLAESSPATSVRVAAGFFHDPRDDANPETSIEVTSTIPRLND